MAESKMAEFKMEEFKRVTIIKLMRLSESGSQWEECFWVNLREDNKMSESNGMAAIIKFKSEWMTLSQIELVGVRIL